MKTNELHALTAVAERGIPLYTKLFIAFAIIALLFVLLPSGSVLAAPESVIETDDLALVWKNKLHTLQAQGDYYDTVRLLPADFKKTGDLDLANMFLDKYGLTLKQANTVVFNHAGFDINGHVLNEKQALKSVQDLAMHIHTMRGLRVKIEYIEELQD
jgi:hypothetical protein